MSLVLSEEDVSELSLALKDLLKNADARCALLVDQDGQCLVRQGSTRTIDCDALSALIAGSFASTRALAKLVGETEFSVLFHQGEKDHIHNLMVDNSTILAVIFDDRTTMGMVRLYSKDASKRSRAVLARARENSQRIARMEFGKEGSDAAEEAKDRIDSIFGG